MRLILRVPFTGRQLSEEQQTVFWLADQQSPFSGKKSNRASGARCRKSDLMKVAFRADASVSIGSGHIMRCLTLADQLRGQGAAVVFLCADLPGSLLDVVRARSYVCAQLSSSVVNSGIVDAAETKAAIAQIMPGIADWLVVDQYGLDFEWEERVRGCCRRLMVIDDVANRRHSCDLLLDQNYEDRSRYRGLVPADCRQLLGPSYALLRPEYAQNRRPNEFRRRPFRRVFVFFGGSDSGDQTGKTLKALMDPELAQLEVDVVVGGSYMHHERLSALSKERGRTTIHGPQRHLADLMMAADLAVGAGGVTNWERMTLGLPSLVITLAENQVPISEQLHRQGIIRLLGKQDNVSADHIRDAILDEIGSGKYLDRIAPSMAMSDGLGAGRVLNAMQ
jgi:UDP-2,4-diacetamido-2,4,6-trideoxy-beta-L-altropyranose hydrolase